MKFENREVLGYSKPGKEFESENIATASAAVAFKNCRPTMLIAHEGDEKGIWIVSYSPGDGVIKEKWRPNTDVTGEAVEFMYSRWLEHCKY